jgi:hypothetical protein
VHENRLTLFLKKKGKRSTGRAPAPRHSSRHTLPTADVNGHFSYNVDPQKTLHDAAESAPHGRYSTYSVRSTPYATKTRDQSSCMDQQSVLSHVSGCSPVFSMLSRIDCTPLCHRSASHWTLYLEDPAHDPCHSLQIQYEISMVSQMPSDGASTAQFQYVCFDWLVGCCCPISQSTKKYAFSMCDTMTH